MNNISFQGKTNLILSPQKYDMARAKTLITKHHITKGHHNQITKSTHFTTETDSKNFAVIINSSENGICTKFNTDNIEKRLREMVDIVDNFLREPKEKLTAWIVGGEKLDGPNGDATVKMVNQIAEVLCDRPDIDTSILAGSKKGFDQISFYRNKSMFQLTLDKKINPEKPLQSELEKYFDIVELNNVELS